MEKDTFLSPPVKSSSIENGRKKTAAIKNQWSVRDEKLPKGVYTKKRYNASFVNGKLILFFCSGVGKPEKKVKDVFAELYPFWYFFSLQHESGKHFSYRGGKKNLIIRNSRKANKSYDGGPSFSSSFPS